MKAISLELSPDQILAICAEFLDEYRAHLDSPKHPLDDFRIDYFHTLFSGKLDAVRSLFPDFYSIVFQSNQQLYVIADEYRQKLRNASASYVVEHIEPDPAACPDCMGTGLDFTHHADHCLSCRITYQSKPGDSARSPAGASGSVVGQGKHQ
jgi:hypothetical protein